MLIDAKAHRWTVKGLFFGVLLGMLAVLAVLPAQAEDTSLVLERIRAKKQSVEVLDAEVAHSLRVMILYPMRLNRSMAPRLPL